jgi:predicted alpha/beta-hydrolase family hydrolase
MPFERRQIAIGEGRSVSAVVAYPSRRAHGPATTVILAHGAGNDMHSTFLSAVHEGLAERGFVCVKFNFPYKEKGGRAPDPAPVLEACYARVLDTIRRDKEIGAQRIVIGGKSLGGRMASHLAAKGEAVSGLIFLGYPLHPPGKPEKLRVAHLPQIRAPMLFFTGTRDSLCTLALLRRTIEQLSAPVDLHIIEGGDHSFALPKALRRDPHSVLEEIVATSAQWLEKLG